jgi:hypothetical protein
MIRGEIAVFCSVLSVLVICEELSSFPVLKRYGWGYRKSRHQKKFIECSIFWLIAIE